MKDFQLSVEYVNIEKILPYKNNARQHGDDDVDAIMASIKEFGFNDPIGVWKDIIVEGHGRLLAAKRLGMETVPVIRLDHLTDEQRKAYALAHNRTAELSVWDYDLAVAELKELSSINMSEFGFPDMADLFFDQREKENDKKEAGNDTYNQFIDKFKGAKTTDDCYTPENVYNALAEWVAKEYGIERQNFIRPFYPGGDYQSRKYADGEVVVDNPPFSILSEIVAFYGERGIPFFLFAPTLTLFSSSSSSCAIPVGVGITYENMASVNTSFLTNLEGPDWRVRTAPELYQILKQANQENLDELRKELPKYSYPDEVITAPMVARWSKYGIEYRLKKSCSEKIGELESQKEQGKAIFGSGYITSEKAAAEKAAAEKAAAEKAAAEKAAAQRWFLSENEKDIVRRLSENDES